MAKNVLLGSSNICLCFLGSRQFLTGPLFVECRKLGSLPYQQGAAVGVTQLFLKKKVKEPSREDSENLGWNTDDKKKGKK